MLSDNIYDYNTVSQGKITIPNVDDAEEFELTDVSNIVRLLINDPRLLDHRFSHRQKNPNKFRDLIVWYETPNAITH
jgi:hypothetical protein